MITKTLLTAADVAAMFAAVLEYNRRGGSLLGVAYHAADGSPLPVAYAEVYAEEPGLAVRAAPEPQADELDRLLNPPVADPRKVPAAASIGQLRKLAE